jgi:hypothetical protein
VADRFASLVFGQNAPSGQVIAADYDPVKNGNLTIDDRLTMLMGELEDLETEELEL